MRLHSPRSFRTSTLLFFPNSFQTYRIYSILTCFFLKYNLTDTSATGFFEVQYSTSQSPRSSVMIGSNCIPQCVCYMYMNSILEGTFFYSVEELYCGDIFQAILRLKIIFGVRIRIGDMLRSGLRLDVHL